MAGESKQNRLRLDPIQELVDLFSGEYETKMGGRGGGGWVAAGPGGSLIYAGGIGQSNVPTVVEPTKRMCDASADYRRVIGRLRALSQAHYLILVACYQARPLPPSSSVLNIAGGWHQVLAAQAEDERDRLVAKRNRQPKCSEQRKAASRAVEDHDEAIAQRARQEVHDAQAAYRALCPQRKYRSKRGRSAADMAHGRAAQVERATAW